MLCLVGFYLERVKVGIGLCKFAKILVCKLVFNYYSRKKHYYMIFILRRQDYLHPSLQAYIYLAT